MDLVKDKMYKNLVTTAERCIKQLECEHDWHEHGHGYNCKKCEYYTGLHGSLNKLIEESL